MTVRAAGLDVIFQPLAVNFHQEGGTFGTESTSNLKKRLMAENKEKFLSKWSYVLQVYLVVFVDLRHLILHPPAGASKNFVLPPYPNFPS